MKGRIIGLDHLGVAVRDPRARLAFWSDTLGLDLDRVEIVASEGVRTWFLALGGAHVELLEPTGEESPIAKAIEKRGEGIHHVCLRVDDIDAVLARLAARGLAPIGAAPRPGAGGCRVAFLHPKDTGGVLVELSEPPVSHALVSEGVLFGPGTLAIAYLRDPREKLFGVIRSLDGRGLAIEGLDLEAWEDWVSQCARGDAGPMAPSLQFFPASRIEKLLADRDEPSLPSLARRFLDRTGANLLDALDGRGGRAESD